MKKTIMAFFFILVLSVCFLSTPLSFSEELIPEPGTVIDSTNIRKYAHLLPPEFLPIFENKYDELVSPPSFEVGEPIKYYSPPKLDALSAENKGKYSLDAEGKVVGGWDRYGFPFPDLQRDDQEFITKFMWNFHVQYNNEQLTYNHANTWTKRKGERTRVVKTSLNMIYFTNRIFHEPVPIMKTPSDNYFAQLFQYHAPASYRNIMNLSIRYRDLDKADETFIYIPTLRRVLRGDSGQRAVPLQGSIMALDDMNMFDGKIEEFTYKLIGEQKMLVFSEPDDFISKSLPNPRKDEKVPLCLSGQLRPADLLIIDIFAKDPSYPVSRKRVYVHAESLSGFYGISWDRSGELWKIFLLSDHAIHRPDGTTTRSPSVTAAVDVQFGMAWTVSLGPITKKNLTGDDLRPSNMLKRAR